MTFQKIRRSYSREKGVVNFDFFSDEICGWFRDTDSGAELYPEDDWAEL